MRHRCRLRIHQRFVYMEVAAALAALEAVRVAREAAAAARWWQARG